MLDRGAPGIAEAIRTDAIGRIINQAIRFTSDPKNSLEPNAPTSFPLLWDAPRHDYVQWTGFAPNAGAGSLTMVEDLLSERPATSIHRPEHELLGRQLPPFQLPDLRTGMVRTSLEWAERKYILNFFASW